MPSAGDKIRAGDGYREVARTTNLSSTSTFTAETVTDSVTFTAVDGVEYKVTHSAIVGSSVAGDCAAMRIREDSLTGAAINGADLALPATGRLFGSYMRGFWTASSTGSKTIVVTGQRASGTGNITRAASTANPSLLTVEKEA